MHITAKIIQETSNKRLKTSKGEFISGEKKDSYRFFLFNRSTVYKLVSLNDFL